MPNIMNQELVKAVCVAYCYLDVVITNFTVEEKVGRDYIVISFDRNMNRDQCEQYLYNLRRIIQKFCVIGGNAEYISFDTKSFPFSFIKIGELNVYEGKYKYSVSIEEGEIFNLKCLLAIAMINSQIKEYNEEERQRISNVRFTRGSHLCCIRFHDKNLQDPFVNSFSDPDDVWEIKGNSVYMKNIFDDPDFIKDILNDTACETICRFEATERENTKYLKGLIIDYINRKSDVSIYDILYTNNYGIIVPITQDDREILRVLNKSEVDKINNAFEMEILRSYGKNAFPRHIDQEGILGIKEDGVYIIDFSYPKMCLRILSETIQGSVVNKDHELSLEQVIEPSLDSRQCRQGLEDWYCILM